MEQTNGDLQSALADANKAVDLDSEESAAAYNERGLIYIGQQKFQMAADDFDSAVRIDPKFAAGFANRGFART